MMRGIRRFISLFLVACAITTLAGLRGDKHTQGVGAPQVATGLMEVHIRRLHLVRPDLIPYPIAYEVIC
jgi:hypothetical protein